MRCYDIIGVLRYGSTSIANVVFAALAVARYLQDATGLSIRKIVRTLRPLQQITVRIAGYEQLAEDPLTDTAEAILRNLNLPAQ